MQETAGDIFDYLNDAVTDAICIFTNGIVNNSGQAVAGAGQAGAAAQRWNNFKELLGKHIKTNGNIIGILGKATNNDNLINNANGKYIVSFPTKHHFKDPSVPELIIQSATTFKIL